jgi:hypothetical protein
MSTFESINVVNGQQADAATASGNPLRIAGTYQTSAPTLTTGEANSIQLDVNANLKTVIENGVASGTAGTPSSNVLSVQGITSMTPLQTQVSGATSGGASYSNLIALSTPTIQIVKSSAGSVVAVRVFNVGSNAAFLKLFDTAGTITLGTTSAAYQFVIPANTAGAGAVIPLPELRSHVNSIKYVVTGAIAYNDNTTITANTVVVDISYN